MRDANWNQPTNQGDEQELLQYYFYKMYPTQFSYMKKKITQAKILITKYSSSSFFKKIKKKKNLSIYNTTYNTFSWDNRDNLYGTLLPCWMASWIFLCCRLDESSALITISMYFYVFSDESHSLFYCYYLPLLFRLYHDSLNFIFQVLIWLCQTHIYMR